MQARLKYLSAAILMVWLFSCTPSSSRRSIEADLELPGNWAAQPLTESADDTLWWSVFGDDSLKQILSEAFQHNYDLQIAAANLNGAAARAKIAGAPLWPQINAGASALRRKQNFIGLPIPTPGGGVLTDTSNTFGVSLDVSWEVDLWGRIRSDRLAALATMQAGSADYQAARLSLSGQISKLWFSAIEAGRQVELALATVENFQLTHQQVERRYQSGLVSSLDMRLSMTSLANARANLSLQRARFDSTVRQLEILLGRYPAAALTVSRQLPDLQAEIPGGLPSDLLSRRPDLIAAERRLLAADASLAGAKRALLPQIRLTGSLGTSSDEVNSILNGDFSIWSVAGSILQPLFQGGRLRANIKLAGSQVDANRALYLKTILTAFAEVETALANQRFLAEREAALQVAVEQAVAARELAEAQYSRGISNFLNMLEAQRSAFQNESQLISVRRERLASRVDLHIALGGGF